MSGVQEGHSGFERPGSEFGGLAHALRSPYTWLISSLVFPLQEKLKQHDTVRVRQGLWESQWLPREQLEAQQVLRLRGFLADIGNNVPFYRALFARIGFDPTKLESVGDLQALPFLTKSVISEHSDDLRAIDANGLARFNTGGSSGEPLVFYIGKQRVSHDVAAKWRATRWWGVDIGDPEIVVWGSPIELGAQDRVRLIRDKLMRTELLPAFEMSESRLDEFLARIRNMRPRMLFGYPSSISLIATHAGKRGQRMDDLGIKVVFVTSERLYDHQRQVITETFGAPVANGYGGRDAGFIAHECPHGSMHITHEDIVVEIVDPQGRVLPAGQAGEIVVTHLATRDYPFVRYKTGDVGVLSTDPCKCGRGLPVLSEIQGRSTDFVVAQDGTVMHGLALIYVLRDMDCIKSFRIVQESRRLTRVLVVPEQGVLSESAREQIVTAFRKRLGHGVEVLIELVDEVPAERSGKFRYVISRVTA